MASKDNKDKKTPEDEYTELKNQLTKEILHKQELNARLTNLEDAIYEKENEYFNESTYGNIVKGFENFAKNTSSASSNKKRIIYTDDDHIFSLSSTNYIKSLMKRQGNLPNAKDDFDDFEDAVEPPTNQEANSGNGNGNSNGNGNGNGNGGGNNNSGHRNDHLSESPNSTTTTPGRKRKIRTLD